MDKVLKLPSSPLVINLSMNCKYADLHRCIEKGNSAHVSMNKKLLELKLFSAFRTRSF